jgi:hypothetical protein
VSALRESQLLELAERLSEKEIAIVALVGEFRLVQTGQLERLFFNGQPGTDARGRHCRRQLARLVDLGLLRRLERRVGGVRAGSAGHVYALAPAGRRLSALARGTGEASNRGVHEPGVAFVRHTLAIADLYVQVREAERSGVLDLLGFEAEPESWRSFVLLGGGSGWVKPDAMVRVGVGEWEERSFVEIDLGSEGRGALIRKIGAYVALFRSGREQAGHGVFPRVVFLTHTDRRAREIAAIATQAGGGHKLFVAGTTADAITLLTGQTAAEDAE